MSEELKTLKDFIEDDSILEVDDFVNIIKAEAIKWVKSVKKGEDFSIQDIFLVMKGKKGNNNINLGICVVMSDFFNITEEDLE